MFILRVLRSYTVNVIHVPLAQPQVLYSPPTFACPQFFSQAPPNNPVCHDKPSNIPGSRILIKEVTKSSCHIVRVSADVQVENHLKFLCLQKSVWDFIISHYNL